MMRNWLAGKVTVVAVGDVQCRYILENLRNAIVHLPVADDPQPVAETVLGRKVVVGRSTLHHALDQRVDLGVVGIGEEDRFDVGPLAAHVLHAILLLVGTCQFVLLDRTVPIILEMAAHRQSVLRPSVHGLRIDVIVFFLVLLQPAPFAPQTEILDRTVVDLLGMFIGDRIEIDLRFDDVQQRTFARFGFGLRRVEHVVRPRSDLGGMFLRRADSPERFDS